MNLVGQRVQFRISDIYLPEPVEVLLMLYGAELINGQIRGVAERSDPDGMFVLVEAAGISQLLILPIDKIHQHPARDLPSEFSV